MQTVLTALRVVLSLACVFGLIWFLGRKMRGTGYLRRPHAAQLSVIARQSLGKGSGIALVQVGGRALLLGVGERGVCLLTEVGLPGLAGPADECDPGLATVVAAARHVKTREDVSGLHGSILSGETWRDAIDVVRQRTVRQ